MPIAPCYQCPAVFDSPEERASHVVTRHTPQRIAPFSLGRMGRGKSLTTFALTAPPDVIRKFNELYENNEGSAPAHEAKQCPC